MTNSAGNGLTYVTGSAKPHLVCIITEFNFITPAHTMAHATLVGHRDIQSAMGAILGSHHLISALHWCYCSSCDFGESAKSPPEKQIS